MCDFKTFERNLKKEEFFFTVHLQNENRNCYILIL